MENVIDISKILKKRSKYQNTINNIKYRVMISKELYRLKVDEDNEMLLDSDELFEHFDSIINFMFDNLDLKEIKIVMNVIKKIIKDYADQVMDLGFILATYVILIKTTNKRILGETPEEQVTICDLIDSLGEDAYKNPKYINIYLNDTIRSKLKEVMVRKKIKLEDLFVDLVENLESNEINYNQVTKSVINMSLTYLNRYLKVFNSEFNSSYEEFCEQYYYLRMIIDDDTYDPLFKKLYIIMQGKDEELKRKINLIASQRETMIKKIELLDLLLDPPEKRIINVDFQKRQLKK